MENNRKKTLYLECYNGISGDMFVGALLDLGADKKKLSRALGTLPVSGFRTEIHRVKKAGLDCCDFCVLLDEAHENHDHDMEYLYGHRDGHSHDHEHEHKKHDHEAHTHQQEHRKLKDILSIIEQSQITERAKKTASDIFCVLAQAEAKAHGETTETVHFHEVGAVDSIVDIVAAAVCLDDLEITEVIVPELFEGKGTVRCAHGILPVPVPAVMNIAVQHNIRLHITEAEAELVTPTGAAIVAAIRTADQLPEQYRIAAAGMGAGKRDYASANFLRAFLIEVENQNRQDVIYKLESNIDDCSGEVLGYVMGRLFEEGARDVNYMPVFMKKNRPAYQINIICRKEDIPRMEEILFRETTTIGVRRVRMERTVLERHFQKVSTSLGEVRLKICETGKEKRIYPEYESVAEIAGKQNLPYPEVLRMILQETKDAGL